MSFAYDSVETTQLLDAVAGGDNKALEHLLTRYRHYLQQVVSARLDRPMQQRVDASDIVQETLVVASQRVKEYLQERPIPFRLWLRKKAMERLVDTRRRHLALKRDARRDLSISEASSLIIARALSFSQPEDAALKQERTDMVAEAIRRLSEFDQEVLLLRHGEGLTNSESAIVLEVDPRTASKRYGRAIARLSVELRKLGFLDPVTAEE